MAKVTTKNEPTTTDKADQAPFPVVPGMLIAESGKGYGLMCVVKITGDDAHLVTATGSYETIPLEELREMLEDQALDRELNPFLAFAPFIAQLFEMHPLTAPFAPPRPYRDIPVCGTPHGEEFLEKILKICGFATDSDWCMGEILEKLEFLKEDGAKERRFLLQHAHALEALLHSKKEPQGREERLELTDKGAAAVDSDGVILRAAIAECFDEVKGDETALELARTLWLFVDHKQDNSTIVEKWQDVVTRLRETHGGWATNETVYQYVEGLANKWGQTVNALFDILNEADTPKTVDEKLYRVVSRLKQLQEFRAKVGELLPAVRKVEPGCDDENIYNVIMELKRQKKQSKVKNGGGK